MTIQVTGKVENPKLGDILVDHNGNVIPGHLLLNSGWARNDSPFVRIEKDEPLMGEKVRMYLSKEEITALYNNFVKE